MKSRLNKFSSFASCILPHEANFLLEYKKFEDSEKSSIVDTMIYNAALIENYAAYNDAIDKICRFRKIKLEKANFSFACSDLSHISDFTKPFSNEIFRLMKNTLPGPFTYILNANSKVPGIFKSNKKTIGIRVPDNAIAKRLILDLGNPLMVTSVHNDDEYLDYLSDPEEIDATLGDQVDLVIDGGPGSLEPSTVIDCTGQAPILIREGKGILPD